MDRTPLLSAAMAEVARRLAVLTGDESPPEDWDVFVDLTELDDDRWSTLIETAGLEALDVSLLVAAAATDLDERFAEIYAGVSATTARPGAHGPTVSTLLRLVGRHGADLAARQRLAADGRLRAAGLIDVTPDDGPLLAAHVTAPARVVDWMLGSDDVDPALRPMLATPVGLATGDVVSVGRALESGLWTIWIRAALGGGHSVGASALAALGAPSIVLDLERLAPSGTLDDVLHMAWREAALVGGGVVVGPVLATRDAAALSSLPAQPPRPTVIVSPQAWDPGRSATVPVVFDGPRLAPHERTVLWQSVLDEFGISVDDAAATLAALRLAPEQFRPTIVSAVSGSLAAGEELTTAHLRAAALAHGSTRLIDLADRITPEATFDDLVAPHELMAELRSLPARHATRHVVRGEWGLGRGGGRGVGLTCLFAGPSGTGKTLAAEVIANALGVDLFVIDLSQIVDKYIGETEKNLERVFAEAESVNGVLLFDEADALFGKRSEVQSSHDRHANIEVAYLLQRMERYDGVAVLTTNLRGNIDEAFLRRLDVVCAFADPDVDQRRELWRRHLPEHIPLAGDIDIETLAAELPVSGGIIRNITLTAAHAAAAQQRAITMHDLTESAAREYRKMGRLFSSAPLLSVIAENE